MNSLASHPKTSIQDLKSKILGFEKKFKQIKSDYLQRKDARTADHNLIQALK
jgi:hypothetical protein